MTEPARSVVRSEAEWRAFLENLEPADDGPARVVDFRREVVLVAALGARDDGGMRVTFGHAAVVDGEAVVEVVIIVPDPVCDRIPVESTPLAAASLRIRPQDTPVRMVDVTTVDADCP